MAGLVPKLTQEEIDEFGDICHNLQSIQFESALTENEAELVYLRKRAHALTVFNCAQATYFASIFSEARQIEKQLQYPEATMASRMFKEATKEPTLVGIVGCGRMGSHIAHCLLTFGEFTPEEIKISTRRPETLTELSEKGVTCCFNNRKVASSCHLLFICVLPSQFQTVAEEIKGHIFNKCIVYCLMSAMTLPRVMQLLEHKEVILPMHEIDEDVANTADWDFTQEVTGAFADNRMLELSCPLSFNKEGAVITTNEKFLLQMFYALINYLTKVGIQKMEVTNLLNAVIIGHTKRTPKDYKLVANDFQEINKKNIRAFQHVDLIQIATREVFLGSLLMDNTTLRKCVVDKYCGLFQHYLEWKKQALQLTKKQKSLEAISEHSVKA